MENKNWFNKSVEETIDELKTDASQGLSGQEVEKRKAEYGLNELEEGKKTSLFVKFLKSGKSVSKKKTSTGTIKIFTKTPAIFLTDTAAEERVFKIYFEITPSLSVI